MEQHPADYRQVTLSIKGDSIWISEYVEKELTIEDETDSFHLTFGIEVPISQIVEFLRLENIIPERERR